jgi:malignant T-cell-amplified sequence
LKRHVVSKHESREMIEKLQASSGITLDVSRSSQVEFIEPEEGVRFIVVDGVYTFVEAEGEYIPFVGSQRLVDLLPSVRVDDGALKYILNGADVMRPGIVKFDDWGEKGRLVVVRDDKKGRGLAVGRALVPSSEMSGITKGMCVKNLHRAGDRFWMSHKAI